MWIEIHGVALAVGAGAGALAAGLAGGMVLRRHAAKLRDATKKSVPTRDAVTGLMPRAAFDKRVSAALEAADLAGETGCMLYAGLDGLRLVNDRHGHEAGDAVLREAAKRLRAQVGKGRLLCRVAGDEFAIWLPVPLAQAEVEAQHLVAALAAPVALQEHMLEVGVSVGVAQFPEHGGRSRIVSRAAAAMRSVKLAGGHAHAVFNPRVAAEQREEAQLAQDLKHAIARREFELFYQPKVETGNLQITAAEALLRWKHATRGMVSPALFIPLAERHGLIGEIGNWVLDEALRQAAVWRRAGLRMRVAINVSGYQMRQDDFALRLERGLKTHGLQASRFTCEITESVAMEDTAVTQRAFERLGKIGVHVSIDDFGTGHSSLASLRRLPAQELKIDRAFVADLAESADARSIVLAVVQMAKTLGLRVVAEGVETEAQRDHLMQLGCDEMQGYLFAKPMSARALGLWAMDGPETLAQTFRSSMFKDTLPMSSANASTQVMPR